MFSLAKHVTCAQKRQQTHKCTNGNTYTSFSETVTLTLEDHLSYNWVLYLSVITVKTTCYNWVL